MLAKKLKEIKELEKKFERTNNKDIKKELKTNIFKMLDATQASREIMYARQKLFEYRDKPNKQPARVLAETRGQTWLAGKMVNKAAKIVDILKKKLNVFSTYYTDLFKSVELFFEDIQSFLEKVNFLGC